MRASWAGKRRSRPPNIPPPYVEKICSRPAVVLDSVARDNLLNNGTTFVDEFTGVPMKQIDKAEGPQARGFLK